MHTYLVNVDGKPEYIRAKWCSINKGHLIFWINDQAVKNFKLTESLYFDDLCVHDKTEAFGKIVKMASEYKDPFEVTCFS